MDVLNIAASALVSAGQAARIRANNIVNANRVGTGGAPFTPQEPVFSPIVNGGGVALLTQNVNQPVNLIGETLGLLSASHQYKAAANLIRRADDMHAALLRTVA